MEKQIPLAVKLIAQATLSMLQSELATALDSASDWALASELC